MCNKTLTFETCIVFNKNKVPNTENTESLLEIFILILIILKFKFNFELQSKNLLHFFNLSCFI